MKKLSVLLLALGISLLGVALLAAHGGEQHEAKADEEQVEAGPAEAEVDIDIRTVKGEVIDITCYMRHDSRGEQHVKCALSCAELGMPLGVLEEGTNQIYLLLPPGHEDPKGPVLAFIGKPVEIEGIIFSMGGMQGLEIEQIAEASGEEEEAGDHH
jgi:hypothetical protein